MKIILMTLLLALGMSFTGCTHSSQSLLPPTNTIQNIDPVKSNIKQSTQYVYVADRGAHQLLVYPYGTNDPSPINNITYQSGPGAVAVAQNGTVYVTHDTNTVTAYSPGTLAAIANISVNKPLGIYVDATNSVYIVVLATISGPSGNQFQTYVVQQFTSALQFVKQYVASNSGNINLCGGVVVNSQGVIFASALIPHQYGAGFIEVYPNPHEIWNMGGPGGVAITPNGRLISGSLGTEFIYEAQPPYNKIVLKDWRQYGEGINLLSDNNDGILAVPFTNSAKVVIKSRDSGIPIVITKGLQIPNSAAVSDL